MISPQGFILPPTNTLPVRILESRRQYACCHVALPNSNQRLAAIRFGGSYYSFFRSEPERSRAVKLALKLYQRGDAALLTQTPKGYAVWVLEPDARAAVSRL